MQSERLGLNRLTQPVRIPPVKTLPLLHRAFLLLLVIFLAACTSPPPVPDQSAELEADEPIDTASDKPPTIQEALTASREALRVAVQEARLQDALAIFPEYRSLALEAGESESSLNALYSSLLLAAGRLDEAQQLPPGQAEDNLELLYARTLASENLGDAELRAIYERMLAIDGEEPRALAGLGLLALQADLHQEAYRYFSRSISADPQNLQALLARASLLADFDRPADALKDLDAAVAAYPDLDLGYVQRARIRSRLGNASGARQDLDQAVELNPDSPWHRIDRGRHLFRAGELEAAVQDFSVALNHPQTNENFLVLANRAQALDLLARSGEAAADYRQVFELRPDYYPAYPGAAVAFLRTGSYSEAQRYFLQAAEGRQGRNEFYLMAALAGYFGGRTQETNRSLSEWMAGFDRDSIWYTVGRFLLGSGNDSFVVSQVERHPDPFERAQAQVFLGAKFMLGGFRSTALALLAEMGEDTLRGTPEGALAEWLVHEYQSN